MMIADLHIHSKYSRATSKTCVPEYLDLWARKKGIELLGTGDFTHPAWREELREKLKPAEGGLYVLRETERIQDKAASGGTPRFVLSGEISSIYKKNGKVRKVHNVILLPGLEEAEALAKKLEAVGNIHSDGRPILGLDCHDLLEMTLETCPEAVFIPAHIWTPHFSLFGAFSGFDTIEECFEDLTPYIHALETGLSSDPVMNWQLSALDRFTLVSNSDAHSPAKLGRETNLLDIPFGYPALARALQEGESAGFRGTIEFFPEEGKYHFDGHRNCHLCLKPAETVKFGGRCPVCGKKITIGVQHRVEELADREAGFRPEGALPFESLAPLLEVIAASTGLSATSKKVDQQYEALLQKIGPEFVILREAPLEEISHYAGPCVAEGIRRLRAGEVERIPGYDGEYGVIKLLDEAEIRDMNGQTTFLSPEDFKEPQKEEKELPALPQEAEPELAESAIETQEQDLLEGLNPEQLQAVMTPQQVTAVVAGPGTGKTKTLVSRIAYLVQRRGVKPSEMTAVTFTNKAAAEMRLRLEKQLGKRAVRAMTIGTFHAICLELLQELGETRTLIGGEEAAELAEQVIQTYKMKMKPKRFLQEISNRKNGLEVLEAMPEEVCIAYQNLLQEKNVMDLDDILLDTVALWEQQSILKKQGKRFQHLLVDEFQDINRVQHQLIQVWAEKSKGLFVIGDPDQSIYGFRGAEAACFKQLEETYPTLQKIYLSQNYRCTPEILECALAVMEADGNGERRLKANRENGEKTQLLTAESALSEGIFVAKKINRMVGGIDMLDAYGFARPTEEKKTRSFSEMAVLYRTHRQCKVLEQCLAQEGIPYVVVGQDELLTDPIIRGIIAFFRFLLSPEDFFSMRTSLKLLIGVDETFAAAVQEKLQGTDGTLQERLAAYQTGGSADAYFRCMAECLPKIAKEKPVKLLERAIAAFGLEEAEPVSRLCNMAVLYDSMENFLNALVLGKESDIVRNSGRHYTSDAVTLMTLHGCKGLEFPVVFLCGVNEGTLPLEMKHDTTDHAEERRLFYVGMTRAQEELYLLSSPKPSLFLSDIPKEMLCHVQARPPKQQEVRQTSMFD
ncbi:MAG: UvrD-helicase domain-containing protein [Clostridia bacterium]|nr:UvrD-helicase domain-containing protein [Clostridia bacterium]